MRRTVLAPVIVLQLWAAGCTAYLLALLALAAGHRRLRRAEPPAGGSLRTVVLIPAHDEEAGLPGTLRALDAQDFPLDRREVLVVADNCSDATADIARATGATVWERSDDERGKGQVLAWAVERLRRERPEAEAIAIVDADCEPAPNLLTELDAALRGGARAAQAIYDVANPNASPTAALRWAGFALKHRVRARGRAAAGLSAGLHGTGMAFRTELLCERPWRSFSVAEDSEYHLDLALGGVRVAYVDTSRIESAMPTTFAGAHQQQLRWESGNATLARRHALPLTVAGLRRRDANLVLAGLELVVPALTLLVPAALAGLCAGALARRRWLTRTGAATVAGQVVYVLAGLRVAEAPPAVYRSLGSAPRLVARKLSLFGRIARGHGTDEWIRTEREPTTGQWVEVA